MKKFVFIALFLAACLCMNGFLVAPAKSVDEQSFNPELVFEAKIENLINNFFGDGKIQNF